MGFSFFLFVIVVFKSKHTRAKARRGYLSCIFGGDSPLFLKRYGVEAIGIGDKRGFDLTKIKGCEVVWEFQVYVRRSLDDCIMQRSSALKQRLPYLLS